jgi:HSP20 family protein
MNLIRFDPFRELDDMSSRLNRLFGRPANGGEEADGFGTWSPAIDVQETDKEYLVKADLPAVNKTDLKINVEDGILTVEGERKQEKEETGKKFHRVERVYGRFVRRLSVPSDVDGTKVAADFKEGVLSVHMPKSVVAKPRTVEVKVT